MIVGGGGYAVDTYNVWIGNGFRDSTAQGIRYSAEKDWNAFIGNMFEDGANAFDDIKMDGNNSFSLTLGNLFVGDSAGSERGVYDVSGQYNIHAFNVFDDHGTAGIELGPGTNNSIIFGNMVETEGVGRIVDNSGENTNII
jgi:hypothetical protein